VIFDELCGVLERFREDLVPLAKRARIFRLESPSVRELFRNLPDEQTIDFQEAGLRLPFDVTAVELCPTRESRGEFATIFYRLPGDEERLGLVFLRSVEGSESVWARATTATSGATWTARLQERTALVEALPDRSNRIPVPSEWFEDLECCLVDRKSLRRIREGDVGDANEADLLAFRDELRARREQGSTLGTTTREEAEALNARVVEHAAKAVRLHANALCDFVRECLALAVLELLFVTMPSRFVVEESPLAVPPRLPPGKVTRSQWRSHFIVLEPLEIRRRLNLARPEHEAGKRAPHERRGHWRRFRAERYREKRGQVAWIEACWIGEREAVLGPNKYVVRLDV
jgi:hypothetical protein